MIEIDIELKTLCAAVNLGPVIFSEQLHAFKSLHLCRQVHSNMFLIQNEVDIETANRLKFERKDVCLKDLQPWVNDVWAGWSDEFFEGTFLDMNYLNQTLNTDLEFWGKSEPNGYIRENCVTLKNQTFNDFNCEQNLCGICNMGPAPVFRLRGLCEKTLFDYHYGWTNKFGIIDQKYDFKGFEFSHLAWNETRKEWKISYEKY